MQKRIIFLKIFGSLLIICATFVVTVVVVNIDKQISDAEEGISDVHDARILATMGILSYESRDILLAVQDVGYYQMLNYLFSLEQAHGSKEKHREEEKRELEKTMRQTQEVILGNTIFLAKRWSTLLSKGKNSLEEQNTKVATNLIRTDSKLSMAQKIEKIRKIQDENQKVFGERLVKIQEEMFKNIDIKKSLDKNRTFWQAIFIWMQIGGLSMLAIAEVIEGLIKGKERG